MGFFDKAKKAVGDLGRKIAECGTIVETIKKKAVALNKKIVLCEGEDSRVVEAAGDCAKEGIARIVLLGNADKIKIKQPRRRFDGCGNYRPRNFAQARRIRFASL